MSNEPSSPRRRHILSSINREEDYRRKKIRKKADDQSEEHEPRNVEHLSKEPPENPLEDGERDSNEPRRSRLRLKTHKRRRHHSRSPGRGRTDESSRHPSRHHHRQRRHHRHHGRSPTPPNPYEPEPLDPEAAFRESLFDAMADDEGAAYWEGVYGQPVHVYSNEKVGPQGELEQMTEEEYASYVRQKMWEKTNAGLLEEKERREKAKRQKEREAKENRKLEEQMERSLRKGEERRKRRQWGERWREYESSWAKWDGSVEGLAWPTESGRREDVAEEKSVKAFFVQGLDLEGVGEKTFAAKLREERVRWHPDKIQQRVVGGGVLDAQVMRDVTAVFQIVDSLWAEVRPK